jgi:hypothetical protein
MSVFRQFKHVRSRPILLKSLQLQRKTFADSVAVDKQEQRIMMGCRQVEQAALFYEFSFERHVPADHLLRSTDRFVEFGDLRRELGSALSSVERHSVQSWLVGIIQMGKGIANLERLTLRSTTDATDIMRTNEPSEMRSRSLSNLADETYKDGRS